MKTPQQIRNEVEKEIENLREGCGELIGLENVDLTCGEEIDNPNSESGCSFLLCEECRKKLIKAEAKLSILTEYDKSIKEMIEDLSNIEFMGVSGNQARKLIQEELLSKIGEEKQDE